MLKKTTFCLFIVALLLGSGNLLAQEAVEFSIAPLKGGAVQLPEGTKLDLRNAAELTEDELRLALEKSTCGGDTKVDKDPAACFACTGAGCTGLCYQIPCGFYINANQQVPPAPGFLSFATGCTTTFVSNCNDLNSTAPCWTFFFNTADVGDNVCIDSSVPLQSVGCI